MIHRFVLDYCQKLNELGIENEILEHPASKQTAEVAGFLKLEFSECVPTLVMKGDGNFLAVVIRGDCRIDFKKIKIALKLRDLRFATPEEFTGYTGLTVGAARVYIPNTQTLIDRRVLEKEYLTGGSGRFDCSIKYKTSDIVKIPESMVVDVTQ